MNKKFVLLGMSLVTVLGATGPINAKSAFAEELPEPVFRINKHDELVFDRIAYHFNQNREDYYNLFKDWYDNSDSNSMIAAFEEYNAKVELNGFVEATDINDEILDQARFEYYFNYVFTMYLLNNRVQNVDEIRCMLDHLMPEKYDLLYFMEQGCSTFTAETEEALDFVDAAVTVYNATNEMAVETFCDGDITLENVYADFKNYMDDYLFAEELSYDEAVSKSRVAFANKLGALAEFEDNQVILDALDNYLNPFKIGQSGLDENFVFGFTSDDVELLLQPENESKLNESIPSCYNVIFYLQETMNYILFNCSPNYFSSAFLLNNAGPVLYKVLDIIEAFKDDDKPNICILAEEIQSDLLMLRDFFENDLLSNSDSIYIVNYFNKLINDKDEEVNSVILREIEENEELDQSLKDLDFVMNYLDSLEDKIDGFFGNTDDLNVIELLDKIYNLKGKINYIKDQLKNNLFSSRIAFHYDTYYLLLNTYNEAMLSYKEDYFNNYESYQATFATVIAFLSLEDLLLEADLEYFGEVEELKELETLFNELGDMSLEAHDEALAKFQTKLALSDIEADFNLIKQKYNELRNLLSLTMDNAEEFLTKANQINADISALKNKIDSKISEIGEEPELLNIKDEITYINTSTGKIISMVMNVRRDNALTDIRSKYYEIEVAFNSIKEVYKYDTENLDKYLSACNDILDDINDLKTYILQFMDIHLVGEDIEEISNSLTDIRIATSSIIDDIYEIRVAIKVNRVNENFEQIKEKIDNLNEDIGSFSYAGSKTECDDISAKIDQTIALIDETVSQVGENTELNFLREELTQKKQEILDKKDDLIGTHNRNVALIIIGIVLFVIGVFLLLYFFGFKKRFLRKDNNEVKES